MTSSFKFCSGTAGSIFPVNRSRIQSTSNLVFFPKKTQTHYCRHVSRSLTTSASPEPAIDPRETAVTIPPESDGLGRLTDANLDMWMIGSVEEIVKNLNKSPLLVHVDADGKQKVVIRAERAVEEEWEEMMREWENGSRRSPDGLIFVGKLQDEKEEGCGTKIWGIVVQGRGGGGGGGGCIPACYLLETTTVNGGMGSGLFAAHYSLIRVSSFRETAISQFSKAWRAQVPFSLTKAPDFKSLDTVRCGVLAYETTCN